MSEQPASDQDRPVIFSVVLSPESLEAGQSAQVMLANEGDYSESYTISWESGEEDLDFLVWQREVGKGEFVRASEHVLEIEAGRQGSVRFKAGLRRRPVFGTRKMTPFQVRVRSSNGETITQEGEVVDQAVVPLWSLPVALLLCAAIFLAGAFLLNQSQIQEGSTASQTAAAATEIALIAVQTLEARETHSAQLTASFPTDTPEPTFTPTLTEIPTETPIPSATPAPTNTPVPTQTPTEGPTTEVTETPTEEGEPTESPGADLLGSTWGLAGYLADLDDLELTPLLPGTTVDLVFNEGGSFSGNSGCNTYTGLFVTDGEELTFENIAGTEIFCEDPEGIMDQEALYLELLGDAEGYRITPDGRLEIVLDRLENNQQVEKVVLVFFETSAAP